MNVNPIIKQALDPLGFPVEPDVYRGNALDYIIFNYADERPTVYADDVDKFDVTTVYVHFFCKEKSPIKYKRKIRHLLRQAGFTILNSQQFYEDDTQYTHVVVECEIEGVINDEEE